MKKHIVLFLFLLLSTVANADVAMEASYVPEGLSGMVASHEYRLNNLVIGSGTGGTFTGGTVASSIVMLDNALVELATGTSSNLALRFRDQPSMGVYANGTDKFIVKSSAGNVMVYDSGAGGYLNVACNLRANATLYADQTVSNPFGYWTIYPGLASSTKATYGTGNANSGLGAYATTQPSMVASGVEAMRFTDSGVLIATGTLTNLALKFFGDENLGIYSPGADVMTLRCGTVDGMLIGGTQAMITGTTFWGAIAYGRPVIYPNVGSRMSATYSCRGSVTPDTGLSFDATSGYKQPSMVASGVETIRFTSEGNHLWPNTSFVTPEGGHCILATVSGQLLIKGEIVEISTTTEDTVEQADVDCDKPLGVVYARQDLATTSVDVGSAAWIIVSGKGDVLMDATGATTCGGILICGATAGRATYEATVPVATIHNREIGHNLRSGAANTLVRAVLHFN